MTLDQVVVGEQKPRRCRIKVAADRRFQPAKLVGVGFNVGIKADQGGPVPARTGGKDGVGDRSCVVVAQGKQTQGPKLVHDRSVRSLFDNLVGQVERSW